MKFALIPFLFCLICGCSRGYDGGFNAPLLHKIDIQQGNVINQEMLNKLAPGMNKKQVKYIMGTPVIIDPFHNERWEYIYSFQEGGKVRKQRHITLHFENGKLAHISGDIEVSNIPRRKEEIVTEDNAIIVPESEQEEKGFFSRLFEKINPLDDE
jgi:outer membrane protein assembly factor BamE